MVVFGGCALIIGWMWWLLLSLVVFFVMGCWLVFGMFTMRVCLVDCFVFGIWLVVFVGCCCLVVQGCYFGWVFCWRLDLVVGWVRCLVGLTRLSVWVGVLPQFLVGF